MKFDGEWEHPDGNELCPWGVSEEPLYLLLAWLEDPIHIYT